MTAPFTPINPPPVPTGSFPPPPPAPPSFGAAAPVAGPTPFTVTTPVSEVSIGADRTAELSVSVSNVTGVPMRVALQLVADEPAKAEWFMIDGEVERDFALGETESYTVKVKVPRTVPAGTYRIRCDAVAEHQPQEVFTNGPTVAFTVAEPTEARKFPYWIIAVAAGIVAVLGVVLFVATRGGDDADVPNVVNIPGAQAIAALNASGFTTDPAAAVVQPCDAPVTSQDLDGDTVTLTFAACAQLRNVPQFVGRNEDNAFNVANQQGFAIEVVRSGTAAACDSLVIAQAPPPNTRTNVGAAVVVVLPQGPEICNKIPPAVGREAFFSGLAG